MLKSIKQITKRTINSVLPVSLQYQQGDKRNILLFASRRGGSTHLGRLVACDPGMRYVDDPFNLNDFDIHIRQVREAHLPHVPYSQFITLSDSEADQVYRYTWQLLNGGLPEVSTYRPPKKRTIIKILSAPPLVDWFAERFDTFKIYLTRHPIPQALSVLRNNWTITAEAYLLDPVFSGKYLSAAQRQTGRTIMEKGSPLEKAVLNWVLENLYSLKYAAKIDLILSYEELVLYPAQAINLVADTISLSNVAGMLQMVNTPSWSSQFNDRETNEAIICNDKEFLIGKWISKVDQSTRDSIGDILSAFDISEYSSEDPIPGNKLCHFRGQAARSAVNP